MNLDQACTDPGRSGLRFSSSSTSTGSSATTTRSVIRPETLSSADSVRSSHRPWACCGRSYRLENGTSSAFSRLCPSGEANDLVAGGVDALAEDGEASPSRRPSALSTSRTRPRTRAGALRVADQRLYAQKHARGLGRAAHTVLLQALFEREPDLRSHVKGVADLSLAVGGRLGLAQQTWSSYGSP